MARKKRNSEVYYPTAFAFSKEQVLQSIEERLERARNNSASFGYAKEYWTKYKAYDKRRLTKQLMQWYVDEVANIYQGYNVDRRPYFLEYTLCILATHLEKKSDGQTTGTRKVTSH